MSFWKRLPPGWRVWDDGDPESDGDPPSDSGGGGGDGGGGEGEGGGGGGGESDPTAEVGYVWPSSGGGGGGESGGGGGGFDSGDGGLDFGSSGGGGGLDIGPTDISGDGGGSSGGGSRGLSSGIDFIEQQRREEERRKQEEEQRRLEEERKKLEEEARIRQQEADAAAEAVRQAREAVPTHIETNDQQELWNWYQQNRDRINADRAAQGKPPMPVAPDMQALGDRLNPPTPPAEPQPSEQPAPSGEQAATVAANAAATAVAQAGGSPQDIASAATHAATTAYDKQTLAQQTPWTRSIFRSTYGDQAEQEWIRQHNAELDRNRQLYGSQEPKAGTLALSGTNAPPAPNRRIGATPPPGPGQGGRYGVNWNLEQAQPSVSANAVAAPPKPPAEGVPTSYPGKVIDPRDAAGGNPPAAGTQTKIPPTPPSQQVPTPANPDQGPHEGGRIPGLAPPAPVVSTPPSDSKTIDLGNPQVNEWVNADPVDQMIWEYRDQPPENRLQAHRAVLEALNAGNPEAERRLELVATAGWLRSTGSLSQAPREWVDSWVEQFKAGKAAQIPLGRTLEERMTAFGITPPSVRQKALQPNERTGATAPLADALGTRVPTSAPAATTDERLTRVLDTERPLDTLALLAADQQGKGAGYDSRQDAYNIAQGIAGMLSGKADAAWAQPYLNDVARLAWARQERDAGRSSDPRNAPVEYIEKWKDAFYGSDATVPLVKELDQQMIDYAATKTPPGKSFDWKIAFGPNGESGLISQQKTLIDCGPNAFSTILRSRGYNVDPGQAFTFAKNHAYHNGSEFTGPDNMASMLRNEAGLQSEALHFDPYKQGDQLWAAVDKELAAGRPVILSSPDHYWVVSGKNEQGQYYAGATNTFLRGRGAQSWVPKGAFSINGPVNTVVTAQGDVDPNSRAVREMNVPPPQTGPANTRAMLSTKTQYQEPSRGNVQTMSTQSVNLPTRGPDTVQTEGEPHLNPTFNEPEVREMQQRILNEMPKIKFDPGDDIPTRMQKVKPALDWLERNYGYRADMVAGLMMAENGVGTADSPAVRGNNLFSLTYDPENDTLATGYAPGQRRWAAYPTINHALARKIGIFSHPANTNYAALWANRGKDPDTYLDNLVKGGYIIDEPGFPIATWRKNVRNGVNLYRQANGLPSV